MHLCALEPKFWRTRSTATRATSIAAMHENMTNTQKYMVPVAGMKAVNASDVEVVDLPPRNSNKRR